MSDTNEEPKRHLDRPVLVGIGASAGGIRALQVFFAQIPPKTGAAYVVVTHLDPQHRSELPQILAGQTQMPVIQVETVEELKPNHVYVIPPDRRLQIVDHQLSALHFNEPHGQRAAIDLFFRSVAERLGDGLAVILSGAGSDGTLGVKAVKEAGGIILVQDPAEAEYSSMPRSAIATGVADFVLPVHDLVLRLVELIALKQSGAISPEPVLDEEALRRILSHLRVRTGHDFSKYKRSTVVRRIARRMQVTRTESLQAYYEIFRERTEEAQALLGDLLISVTTFFRDAAVFKALQEQVLPHLFEGRDLSQPIRVWVAGCATGEEAYTVAMLLLEEASRHDIRPPIQVFGSDLDAGALTVAREGWYSAAIEADVSDDRLHRYFNREGEGYRVRPELRDVVLFAMHDVLKDPPFSRIDLLSCRNLLIYLDRELQEQVCATFHYALKPAGFLVLGASETADGPPGLFRAIERNARIYQSMANEGERPRLLPRLLGSIPMREPGIPFGRAVSPSSALSEAVRHRIAIERLAPPSLLVDDAHRVVHLSDSAGRFIAPSGGPLSGDIVDLVRPELRFELRSALTRAFAQSEPSLSLPIPVRFNGKPTRVQLMVKPIPPDSRGDTPQAIIMFIEGHVTGEIEEGSSGPHQETNDAVRRLTEELELSQSRMRTMREESEGANEELRAANEELQSINEEYRSTSEELETSKEELQSMNEELQTVNSELKIKLDAISRAHSDLQNLMAATDIGTLFLDSALRIKRFTDRTTELFSITLNDEGRPITDFSHQLEYDDLIKDARSVLADLVPVRREVRSRANRWFDMRIRPYRTVDDKIDGVVITFVDMTERLQAENALRESERQLLRHKHLVAMSHEPIFVWTLDGTIVDWNRGCEELYGYSHSEAVGKQKKDLLNGDAENLEPVKAMLLEHGIWTGERKHKAKDGHEVTVDARLQLESFGGERLVLESARDITDRRRWEQRQELLLLELNHRVRNTLTVVQAIAYRTQRRSASLEEFGERFTGRLAALARCHDLLMQSHWRGADLATLAREQLAPFLPETAADRFTATGEPVALPPELATPFGLVFHELATNAAKYGSLSVAGGRVALQWTVGHVNGVSSLDVVWREMDGPSVKPPTRSGGGSSLLEGVIAEGSVKREFPAEGVICTIVVPLAERHGDGDGKAL